MSRFKEIEKDLKEIGQKWISQPEAKQNPTIVDIKNNQNSCQLDEEKIQIKQEPEKTFSSVKSGVELQANQDQEKATISPTIINQPTQINNVPNELSRKKEQLEKAMKLILVKAAERRKDKGMSR